MRVALVIGHLGYGGAERQLAELALRLGDHAVEPHVFCLGGAEEPYGTALRAHGIAVSTVPRRSGFDLSRVIRLALLCRRGDFDLVHSFLGNANAYGCLAAKLARVRCFVASARNADFPRGALRATIDGAVFRRASAIVANARAVAEFTARRFRVPADRFRVVYNGVDVERFRPPTLRAEGPPVVGTVGSLTEKKNPELFASVCASVRSRLPEVRCLHLGEGPLRAAIESRHGAGIHFLGASAAPESFFPTLDVFLLTSDHEGCPNALLEALSCARAAVSTDAGGTPEIVDDGRTGFLVSRGDAAGLTRRVLELLAAPTLRDDIGRAARTEIEKRFAMPRMVAGMTAVYRALLDEAGTPSP